MCLLILWPSKSQTAKKNNSTCKFEIENCGKQFSIAANVLLLLELSTFEIVLENNNNNISVEGLGVVKMSKGFYQCSVSQPMFLGPK